MELLGLMKDIKENSLYNASLSYDLTEKNLTERTITGVISSNSLDRDGDILEPSGMIYKNYKKNPIVLLNHSSYGLPIGKNIALDISEKFITATTLFAPTALGDDVLTLYADGFMKAWSVGFRAIKWEVGDIDKEGYNFHVTKWELFEYSAVTIPANPDAVSKALELVRTDELKEKLTVLKELEDIKQTLNKLVTDYTSNKETVKRKLNKQFERIEKLNNQVFGIKNIDILINKIEEISTKVI